METKNSNYYIESSKAKIDELLLTYDYKEAFCLLIIVLGRMDGKEKIEFIKYYDKFIFDNYTCKESMFDS
jgi:hypothetical protein